MRYSLRRTTAHLHLAYGSGEAGEALIGRRFMLEVDGNELTDKGYINQRATRERRKALVEKLYAGGEGVIVID